MNDIISNAFYDELNKIADLAHMSANDLTNASVSNTPNLAKPMLVRDAKTDKGAMHQLASTGSTGNMAGTSAFNRVAHGF